VIALPDPTWPVLLLAATELVDAGLCVRPVGFGARCYEAVKITMQVRARDFGQNLFMSAMGMHAFCSAVGVACFLA
jgi:hypothetical protein